MLSNKTIESTDVGDDFRSESIKVTMKDDGIEQLITNLISYDGGVKNEVRIMRFRVYENLTKHVDSKLDVDKKWVCQSQEFYFVRVNALVE